MRIRLFGAAPLALLAAALPAMAWTACHGPDIGPPPPLPLVAPRRPPPPSRPRPIDLGTGRPPAPAGVPSPPGGGSVG